ncbi:MAG: TetR/AcrR family transcriptional regulator [Oscillospiraceae bacterium]
MEKKTDLRIERTYLLLHNAFTDLLEEKRFEEVTVNELCERAMIRRTTFYKHFADKYEYFAFYMKELCASFQDQLPPDVAGDELNPYFLSMCRELLRFISRHEKLIRNVADSTVFPVVLDILSEQIADDVLRVQRRMKKTETVDKLRMEGLAAFYSGGLLNVLRLWLKLGTPIDEERLIQVISGFLEQKS